MRLALAAASIALVLAQDDSKERLKKSLKDVELVGTWIYDDLEGGLAEARKCGKPLLVVFRCVP